jgi:hypothetical protein
MTAGSTLIKYERRFDVLVQSLTDIGKNVETEDLITIYSNSLPQDIFGNWIQG